MSDIFCIICSRCDLSDAMIFPNKLFSPVAEYKFVISEIESSFL